MASRAWLSPIVMAIVTAVLAPILCAQTTSQSSPADDPQARFPPGPGRDALFKICSNCHSADSVLGHLKTHAEWSKTLDEMADNGALGSDEEWTQILGYLDRNYSLIFINTATAQELESVLEIAPAVAEAVVRRRAEKGNYKNMDELTQVPGVAAATIEARKDRFVF